MLFPIISLDHNFRNFGTLTNSAILDKNVGTHFFKTVIYVNSYIYVIF
jgi:hypothetical protein